MLCGYNKYIYHGVQNVKLNYVCYKTLFLSQNITKSPGYTLRGSIHVRVKVDQLVLI